MSYKYLNANFQVKFVKWPFSFLLILTIFSFGTLSGVIFAGNDEDASQTNTEINGVPDLTYSVLPRDKEIDQGGSLWLDVQLRNDGKDPVTLFWGHYAYEDLYMFNVTNNSGSTITPPRKRFMPSFEGLSLEHFKQVPAGGSLTYKMLLTPSPGANCQTYYFREPGEYVVEPKFKAIVVSEDGQGSDDKPKFRELWRGYLSANCWTGSSSLPWKANS